MPIMLAIRELSSLRRQTCLCLARLRDSKLELERDEQFMNSPTDGGQAYNFCTAKKNIKYLCSCVPLVQGCATRSVRFVFRCRFFDEIVEYMVSLRRGWSVTWVSCDRLLTHYFASYYIQTIYLTPGPKSKVSQVKILRILNVYYF